MNYKDKYMGNGYDLQLFAQPNTQTTDASGLSPEMKVYYSDYLIDNAAPKLVHDQFGQKHPIPKNGGKIIEFRKYSPLPKMLGVLQEGVTPDGQSLTVTTITSEVRQYGGYVTLSDILLLTAIDNNLVQATKLLGNQAGATSDTITREVLCGGTNVLYSGGVTSRASLVGGSATAASNCYLTVEDVKKAVRALKAQNAEKIGDSFVGIIHPDVAFDLTNDPKWERVKDYDPQDWYEGEIGRIAGVRFVETTEAKIFKASALVGTAAKLTAKATVTEASDTVAVDEAITTQEAQRMGGKKVNLNGATYTILRAIPGGAGTAAVVLDGAVTTTDGDALNAEGGGSGGRAVYATLILGDNAYGVTELEGGGLEHIVKQLGSAGTADALNQRSSVGWKLTKTAERLVEQFMVRIESCSTFDSNAN